MLLCFDGLFRLFYQEFFLQRPSHKSVLIVSRTPVRISFFGGGTDYPEYFGRKKGAVLGTTIDKYTHISLSTPSPFFDHKIRIAYSKTELVTAIDNIEHPSIRECLKYKNNIDQNLDIHIFSDLPARTGLGSSSSFTIGFLNALHALEGKIVSKQKLAEEACFIEQQLIQENVGSQDQFHAAFGGFNIIEFFSTHIQIRPVIISREKKNVLERSLMLFYTGLTRHASVILGEQIQRTKIKANDEQLELLYEMVYEAEQILSEASLQELVSEFGQLLHKAWCLKKKLSSQISNEPIDQAYEVARRAGAYGGKLCGAGGGGFLALVVPEEKKDDVRRALDKYLEVQISFENEGAKIIYMKD